MNRYRPFDQIWAVKIKEKNCFFFSSLTSKMDLSLSLFLFSYGDNKDQEEEEDYFDSSCKKNSQEDEEDLILFSYSKA